MSEIGVQFVKDYHSGRYGYAVRGEMLALMYHQAMFLETDDQRHSLLWCFEHQIGGDGRCAWVGPEGDVVFVNHGGHCAVAQNIFFQTEGEFEKVWAKITRSTQTPKDAWQYVTEPTRHQKRAVEETFFKYRT